MNLKELFLSLVLTVLLIAFFSTMGSEVTTTPAEHGYPNVLGDTGITVSGKGSEPAELTAQEVVQEEVTPASESKTDTETAQESTAEQTADEPTKSKNTLSEEQRTSCNLVSVFLSGVASVLFTELIVEIKKGG